MRLRERIGARGEHLRKELFLQLDRDPSRAALVLGSGRSGTTWLAEAIARRYRCRLLFEPFHPVLGCFAGEPRLFADPAEAEPALSRAARRLLAGRVRGPYIDQIRVARLPRARVVKDVHAANLLPWIRARHPDLPVVFVVRHPIAASFSRLRSETFDGLGAYLETPAGREDAEGSPAAAWLPLYDRHRADPEPLVRLVAEWCIENAYPLGHVDDAGVALAFYENAVRDPVAELERLTEACGAALGRARGPLTIGDARRPSAMDWRGTAAAARRSGDWERLLSRWTDEVPPAVVERCLAVLADFGLERFYGEGPLPVANRPG